MSQIFEYFKSLFQPTNNNNRKRRRTEFVPEEIEPIPKYRRVTNLFPERYNDKTDFFREVKQRNHEYNELLESFLMDQQKKHLKAVLDDGEFSDEEDLNSYRMPSTATSRQKNFGYNFKRFFEKDEQPSTSNAFRRNHTQFTNGGRSNENDEDVQYVTTFNSKLTSPRSQGRDIPELIPISKASINGFSRESSVKPQQQRGRRSVLDFIGKNRAFSEMPKSSKSIVDKKYNMDTKHAYEKLLQGLIPRYPDGAIRNISQPKEPRQITTIDLSDDSDTAYKPASQKTSPKEFSLYKSRKSDFIFKTPTAFVDISDDEADHFESEPCISSTQIIKSRDLEKSAKKVNDSTVSPVPTLPPINTLKEKQALKKSLQDNAIENIVKKFNQTREEKDKSISEEILNASNLERERREHERIQQRRIDESITSALSDKCIIFDEEDEIIDEFPPLNDQQNRFVQYALHGPKGEVIVSKFNMNITRHDLATLEGLNWLNDEVINFYMELIKERSEQLDHLPKVHVMNTFFLGKLLTQGHSGVRRWTRKVDIFSYDIIPIPVHVGGVHWCMSVIHFKNKTIRYYDSMGHPNPTILDALSRYLKEESLDKKKVHFDMSDWSVESIRDCPQQSNGSDCGVFSCQIAEFISRDSTISFEQQHMPYFRRKMIYEIGNGRLFLGN